MKAMILAAGLGTRMRPLTEYTAKVLLPIHGKALIEYHLQHLATAGIREVMINIHAHAAKVQEYLGNGQRYGLQLYYSHEPNLLDTGGGIKQILPWLGNAPLLVVSGDIFTDFPLASLSNNNFVSNFLNSTALAHLVLVENTPAHPEGDFLFAGQRYTYANIAVVKAALVNTVEELCFPLRQPLQIAEAQQQLSFEVFTGMWHNVGTPEALVALNQ
jgi:MurNAc alpha-1-phosphate uridylyltransferase